MDSTTLSEIQGRVYRLAMSIQDKLQSEKPALFGDKVGELCVSKTFVQ